MTDLAELMATEHVPVSGQLLSLQPVKIESAFGVAVSITEDVRAKGAVQVKPQLRPNGELVIVPPPAPVLFTLRS